MPKKYWEVGVYKAKTLFTGSKLGLKNPHVYAGIPSKYWNNNEVTISHKGEIRKFTSDQVVLEKTFPDKFKIGEEYTLRYVLWTRR